MIGKQTILKVDDFIQTNAKQELRDQGHYLTGELEDSFKSKISETSDGVGLDVEALDYLDTLENPTPASQIRISEAEFQKLRQWTLKRGIATNEYEMTRAAAAIVAKWKKEGRPTHASSVYSKTGRRTQAVQISYDKNEGALDKLLDDGLGNELDSYIDKTFDQTIF